MKSYKLASGSSIPALGLGTWKAKPNVVYDAVKKALQIGYRHIDCAPVYDNEPEVGKALAESDTAREELWITSKLWNNAHKPERVIPALKATLSHLKQDYLDLYLIHWPVHVREDLDFPRGPEDFIPYSDIPIAETWGALEECV